MFMGEDEKKICTLLDVVDTHRSTHIYGVSEKVLRGLPRLNNVYHI